MLHGAFAALLSLLSVGAAAQSPPDFECSNEAVPPTTPSSDFTLVGDGSIVRHESTGLEWQRCSFGQTWDGTTCQGDPTGRVWGDALQVAAELGDGWRIPNINELASIVELCTGSSLNRAVFPNTPTATWFWSSTTFVHDPEQAWAIPFGNGTEQTSLKASFNYRLRFVRD